MENPYTIEHYTERDWEALVTFYKKEWIPPSFKKSERWFKWQLYDNPNKLGQNLPLLIARHGDTVVGQIALIPTTMWVNGKPFQAAWGPDLYVATEHRRYKIALSLLEQWVKEFEIALTSGQSDATRAMQNKYHWENVSPIYQFEKLFVDMGTLRNSLKEGPYKTFKRAAAMIYATLFDRFRPGPRDIIIEQKPDFDEGLEAFWLKVSPQYSGICQRDLKTLRWRFIDHPYYKYSILEAHSRDHTYLGYIVTRLDNQVGFIIDILSDRHKPDAGLALIKGGEEHLRKNGAKRIICRCVSPSLQKDLLRLGYMSTPFLQNFYLKSSTDFSVRNAFEWHITLLDSDLDR
jgi:hypothetical protein